MMKVDDSVSEDEQFAGVQDDEDEGQYSDLAESDEAEQQMKLVEDSQDEEEGGKQEESLSST